MEKKDPFFEDKPPAIQKELEKQLKIPPNELKKIVEDFEEHFWLNLPPLAVQAIEKVKSVHFEAGKKIEQIAQIADGFTIWEHFAAAGVVILTAFSSWFITYFRLGFGWWFLILWYLSFIYTKNVERLRYKIKNQALREYMLGVLDTDKEYVEWFNQFLARFWMNYEPELSKGLKDSIGATLDTIKAPGIDEIVLSKFTLGSQAPRIDSIKTFVNTGDEILILDFDLSFTPFDADAISKKEKMRRELRNLEIVLLAKFAMVPLPVSLKELFINGTLRLQFTFMSAYPHIKVIDLGFVKKPTIDFVLKPLGADLSKIAGLGSFIKDTVDFQLAQIIVNPVKMSLPIGEWFGDTAGKTEIPVGVLRVVIFEAKGLKNVDVTGISDPAAVIYIGGNVLARTRVFDNSLDPKWSEVHHIVIYQSMLGYDAANADEFKVEVEHVNSLSSSSLGFTSSLSLRKWISLLGINEEETLSEEVADNLIHEWGSPFETNGNIWKDIYFEQKKHGSMRLDLSYLPIVQDQSSSTIDEILVGIVTITVQQAKEVQSGHISVIGKMDGNEVLRTPVRKRTINPSWNTIHSFYCTNISKSNIHFSILNKSSEAGNCSLNIQKALKSTDDWYKIIGGSGKIRIDVKFQPIDLNYTSIASSKSLIRKVDPIGIFRVKVIEAKDLYVSPSDKASMGLAKDSPYCKVLLHGRSVGVTSTQEKNNLPKWHDTFYTISYSLKEFLVLDVFDSQNLSRDKKIGKSELRLSTIFDLAEGKKIKNLPKELESVKVIKKGNILDVWAPLFTKEDLKLIETLKEGRDDIARLTGSALGLSSESSTQISEIPNTETKIKTKGQIHIEIELYPIAKSKILDFKPSMEIVKSSEDKSSANASLNISSTYMPSETKPQDIDPSASTSKDLPESKSTTQHSPIANDIQEIIKSYSKISNELYSTDNTLFLESGILRLRANHVFVNEMCKPYLEVYIGQKLLWSTLSSTIATSNCYWLEASDHFVLDLSTAKVNLFLKDQAEPKRSSKDSIIGFWTGDFNSVILGKEPLQIHLREYSQNWTGDFASLRRTSTLDISASFFPAILTNVTVHANSGIMHLDILNAKNLPAVDSNGTSDPYVLVNLNGNNVLKTKVQKKSLNPVFDEGVQIDIHARHKSTLYLEIKDFNQFTSDVTLGVLTYPLSAINIATVTTVELPLEGASSGSIKFRYLFEEAILEQVKEENEMKLHTETSALGKLGKGLTSQVTGLGTMFGSVLSAPMKEKKLRKTLTEDHSSSSLNNLAYPRESAASNADPLKTEPTVAEKASNFKLAPTDLFKINTVENSLQKRDGTKSASSITGSQTFSLQSSIDHNSAPIGGDFVEVQIWGAKDLKAADMGGTSDPFIRVTLQGFQIDNKKIHKTAVVKKTLNPVWENEKFVVPLNGTAIKLSILDKNLISNSTPLGHVVLDASTILGSKSFVDEWYRIQSGEGRLRVSMKNISAASSEVSRQKSQKKQIK